MLNGLGISKSLENLWAVKQAKCLYTALEGVKVTSHFKTHCASPQKYLVNHTEVKGLLKSDLSASRYSPALFGLSLAEKIFFHFKIIT